MVKEYLKNHKINNIKGVKKWAVVHVRFLSCEKVFQFGADEDEVSFDIENISSEQGINDLDECFSEFCKEQENHAPVSMITDIAVYASANTKEKLEALTVKEN
jgi:hypothetical protein